MTRGIAIIVLVFASPSLWAGIYPPMAEPTFEFANDGTAEPLSATNFSLAYDDRINAMNPATPPDRAKTRNALLKRIEERLPKASSLDVPTFRELTADLIRVGRAGEAIPLLIPKSREREPDYALMANLVQAYALSGDWDAALRNLEFLRDTEPPKDTAGQRWHAIIDSKYALIWLRYHRNIARDKTDAATLKPIPFFADGLPPNAIAIVQQMALDAPTDIFLLWTLAEVNVRAGDYRTAEKLFDRCTNSGLTQPKALMARRAEVQDIVEKLPKPTEDALLPMGDPEPPPAPKGLFDLVNRTKFFALTGAFALIVVALFVLQVRASQRRRRR